MESTQEKLEASFVDQAAVENELVQPELSELKNTTTNSSSAAAKGPRRRRRRLAGW